MVLTPLMLCMLISYMSRAGPIVLSNKFLRNFLLLRGSRIRSTGVLYRGLMPNKPKYYLIDHGVFISAFILS